MYNPTKTRTWSRTTPADGDLIDDEVDRIYGNTEDLKAALDAALNKQIPLGALTQDDFDELDSVAFPFAGGQSVNRSDMNTGLFAKLRRAVTSLNPSTDRIPMPAHGLTNLKAVKFSFTGGGITANTTYYLRNVTTDDFQVSLTPTGSIVDLTADQTGEMLTNVAWGFGNGSTTINVPDARAMFLSGAGSHGTLLKANGNAYDRGQAGESKLDRFQGHHHSIVMDASGGSFARLITTSAAGSASINLVSGAGLVNDATTDGTNGTPRTGDETAPISLAVEYKVRIA